MNFSTPYLMYILAAYGLSFVGLCIFFCMTLFQWKRSNKLIRTCLQEINR